MKSTFLVALVSLISFNIFADQVETPEPETSATEEVVEEVKKDLVTFKWYGCEVQREKPDTVAIADGGYPLFKAYHEDEERLVGYRVEKLEYKTAVEFLRFGDISMEENILMPLQVYFKGRDRDYTRKYQDRKRVFVRHNGKIWGGKRPNVCEWILDFFVFASRKSVVSRIHISEAIKWLVDKLESENEKFYPADSEPEMISTDETITTTTEGEIE